MFLLQLVDPNADITAIMPEIMLAITGIIVMLFDSFVPKQRYITGAISLVGNRIFGNFARLDVERCAIRFSVERDDCSRQFANQFFVCLFACNGDDDFDFFGLD
jgi:NADH:ubiquinone oxidoreductase subunit 2 (subunit N)